MMRIAAGPAGFRRSDTTEVKRSRKGCHVTAAGAEQGANRLEAPGAIGEMTRRHLPTFAAAGGFIDFAPEVERLINHCRSDCRPVAGYG
jgi:hypothetical protein